MVNSKYSFLKFFNWDVRFYFCYVFKFFYVYGLNVLFSLDCLWLNNVGFLLGNSC